MPPLPAIPSVTRSWSPPTSDDEEDEIGSSHLPSRSRTSATDKGAGSSAGDELQISTRSDAHFLTIKTARKLAELYITTTFSLYIAEPFCGLFRPAPIWNEIPTSLGPPPTTYLNLDHPPQGKLFLGRMPFKSTIGRWDERDYLINKLGITAVLCMTEKKENEAPGYLFSAVLPAEWTARGVIFEQIETPDHQSISQAAFDRAVSFLNKNLSKGHNVLVHCKAGKSRSAAVVAAYLRTVCLGSFWSLRETWAHILRHRPIAYLEPCKERDLEIYCKESWSSDDINS